MVTVILSRCPLARAREAGATTIGRNRTSNLFADGQRSDGGCDDGAGASYRVARDSTPNQKLGPGDHLWPRSLRISSAASERSPWRAIGVEIEPHPAGSCAGGVYGAWRGSGWTPGGDRRRVLLVAAERW